LRVVNELLLVADRGPGRCAWCGTFVDAREAHHVIRRSQCRLDVSWNLLWVGRSQPYPRCPCHGGMDSGRISQKSVLYVVAGRNNCLESDILAVANLIKWLPKEPRPRDIEEGLRRFSFGDSETALLRRTLTEAGVSMEEAA